MLWCVYVYFPTAYKEKMKELSVLSLICSCFYPEIRNKLVHEFEGMNELKNIDFLLGYICPVNTHIGNNYWNDILCYRTLILLVFQ